MWILPNTHPLFSLFVQDTLGLNSDLNEFTDLCSHSLMWRSKPSPSATWLRRWKKEKWLQLLSGRTLKPCHWNRFEEELISLLEDSLVSHSPMQEKKKE